MTVSTKSQASWSLRTEKVNLCDTTLLLPHQTIRELCMIPQATHLAFKSASLETLLGVWGSSDMSHLILLHVCSVRKSCRTLCDPMDCSPPGYSVHGISQTRILEWVDISSSMGSSWPKDRTCLLNWQADSLPLSYLRIMAHNESFSAQDSDISLCLGSLCTRRMGLIINNS